MLNQKLLDQLGKIAGKNNLQILSERVFISPENTSVITEIVKLANKERFNLLPLGSGSILNWSKIHTDKTVILKSDRLNRIKNVVPEDLYVILEPGFPLKDLNLQLESYSLFFPLSNGRSKGTMGGTVATNLKGKSGDRDIQTKEYVLALELINPEGQILHVGARTFKSVTGYDLPRLFVGSWGTLGFISEISLRLVPIKKKKYYPGFIPDPPQKSDSKVRNDSKSALSSRIKKALDPNEVFFNFNSLF